MEPLRDATVEQSAQPGSDQKLKTYKNNMARNHSPRCQRKLAAEKERDTSGVGHTQLFGRSCGRGQMLKYGTWRFIGEIWPDIDVEADLQGVSGHMDLELSIRPDQHHCVAVEVLADGAHVAKSSFEETGPDDI
jgi:hypothetical protein